MHSQELLSSTVERLSEAAHRDGSTTVSVSAHDLRILLDAVSKSAMAGPTVESTEAFASEYGIDAAAAESVQPEFQVWVRAWAAARRGIDMDAMRHLQLLASALRECIVEAGITHPDAPLHGPELLMFGAELKHSIAMDRQAVNASNAVIDYVLANQCESPFQFLHCWNSGDFESLRIEWPEAPDAIYIGPDIFHPKSLGFDSPDFTYKKPLAAIRLLQHCRESLASGLDLKTTGQPDSRVHDHGLILAIEHFLAEQQAFEEGHPPGFVPVGVRDDLTAFQAQEQYHESAKALSRAIVRDYPVGTSLEAEIGKSKIKGVVTGHSSAWWSRQGEVAIRNVKTGKDRSVQLDHIRSAHGVQDQQAPREAAQPVA